MPLRTTTLTRVENHDSLTPAEWRQRVDDALQAGSGAIASGNYADLAALFRSLDGWADRQRAYQARRQLAELAFATSEKLAADSWLELYAVVAGCLLEALEDEPREPVLLNYAGVLVYELTELGAAEALFKAAKRLDPSLAHVDKNLRAVRERKRSRPLAGLRPAFLVRVRELGARARRVAAAARPVDGLRLSLCMIVKDEEEMLPGCLAAVQDGVDEIVVVDTGSSDRTVEIAESFGAKVVHFPWNGSFADARNASIEAASGDWILYLDADEHLEPGEAVEFRRLVGRTWREAFYLVETNYTGGEESGSAVTHLALRLFRNRPQYRFEGRIHEQKAHRMPTYLPERFETTTIRMVHYGYLKSRIQAKDKSKRNLELLLEELRESRTAFTLFNVGSEHLGLDDVETARAYLDEAWDRARAEELWAEVGYVPLLAVRVAKARRQAGDRAAAREAIGEGLEVYPDHTDLLFELALCARDEGNVAEVRRLAGQCLEMGSSPARYTSAGSGTYLALSLLAEAETLAGRTAEAEAVLRRSLAEHPDYLAPILGLAALMLRRGATPDEVRALVPDGKPSALLLAATACYEAGFAEPAEAWFREVLDRQPANGVARVGLLETLLSQRRYEEVAELAASEPDESPVLALAAVAGLFALAVLGRVDDLGRALERAEPAGVPWHELDVYRAWRSALAGEPLPAHLRAESGRPAAVALEALLRVQEIDAFAVLLPVFEHVAMAPRERRELLARMYFHQGFLESAADEWIAVCGAGPDARALVGLAQVALARGFDEDALVFAEEAVALEPSADLPRRLRDAVAQRIARAA
jgi:tetratricopeptide (TPR) repeat protein